LKNTNNELAVTYKIWYTDFMMIEQTVEIPPDHRLFVNVPSEVPDSTLTYKLTLF